MSTILLALATEAQDLFSLLTLFPQSDDTSGCDHIMYGSSKSRRILEPQALELSPTNRRAV